MDQLKLYQTDYAVTEILQHDLGDLRLLGIAFLCSLLDFGVHQRLALILF